ncbi:MAG TPA: hypothetical protein VMF10_10725 [Candidatus Aquilonibacter sp.]|nr:hypothetical protein [Candidatus Aquilonibacter sp.]
MTHKRTKILGIIFSLTVILSGCSSSSSGGGSSATVRPTVNMTASKNPIASGGSTILTVTATNATQIVITDNSDTKTYTLPGSGGTQVVSPTSLTTYMATASDASGFTNVATVTVSIIPTATITASPTKAFPNQAVTLSFSSANASSVTINGADVPPTGTLLEYMTQTTTYTITATGTGGKATASATVTLVPPNTFNGLTVDLANLGPEAQQDVDPNGAVGTKQFMEYVNIQYQAYDKTTYLPVWSSPQIIGTPWGVTGNLLGVDPNCDTTTLPDGSLSGIHLDGVIDFDRLASRWVIMGKASSSNAYNLCLAVSNTDDLSQPSLGWYGYDVALPASLLGTTTAAGQTLTNFPDWPRLGIWQDGYYIAMDIETPPTIPLVGGEEIGVAVCVFDRNDILTQTSPSPQAVVPPSCVAVPVSLDPSSQTYLGHSLSPADIDGTTAPPAGRPEYMVSIENPSITNTQTTSSVINLWEAQVDWSAVQPLTVTALPQLSVTTYTPGCYDYNPGAYAYTNCIPEPQNAGEPELTDSLGDRLMPRFAYRNFGSYESYLISQTVQTGPGSSSSNANAFQTGIRWYELRDNGTGTPSIHQQGTVNPDDVLFRFLPSIAQDKNGNAVVGYSFSNGDTNPGINFSFWNLNTANSTPAEATLLNGPGEELTGIGSNGPPGEWGTYSSMTVDPVDDCTFWYVNEYYPTDSTNNWSTSISNFQIPGCQ